MLEIYISEENDLNFSMELGGISPDQLKGYLNITIDGIAYGVPIKISESGIKVSIPPLKSIVKRELREGEVFQANLEVHGDEHYINPWNDEVKVRNPVRMEVKMDDSQKKKPTMSVSLNEEKEKKKEKIIKEDVSKKKPSKSKNKRFKNTKDFKKKLTKEDVLNWMSKRGTKNKEIRELVYEQASAELGISEPYKILIELDKVLRKR
ncbi:MAG: hypothetical protein PVG65_04475 [Candidatus Thorarchaeota archaeon]|jgi:hypothetical protein